MSYVSNSVGETGLNEIRRKLKGLRLCPFNGLYNGES